MSQIAFNKDLQQSIKQHKPTMKVKAQEDYNRELEKIFADQLQERKQIYHLVVNGKITEEEKENQLCKSEFETYKKLRKLENKYYNFNLYGSN